MTVQTYLNGRPEGDTRTLIRGVTLGHGIVWTALAWIGPLAPPSLRRALERTIASLTIGDEAAHGTPTHG
ncbi:MAG: hypothetical protein ACLP01_07690 [Solirubrobacteraceae bacterium]